MPHSKEELTYNDLWRSRQSRSSIVLLDQLRGMMNAQGMEELNKLDDWKLNIIMQLMTNLINIGMTNNLVGVSHLVDAVIMILQCQSEDDFNQMKEREYKKASERLTKKASRQGFF